MSDATGWLHPSCACPPAAFLPLVAWPGVAVLRRVATSTRLPALPGVPPPPAPTPPTAPAWPPPSTCICTSCDTCAAWPANTRLS